jgi:hypothetical protein
MSKETKTRITTLLNNALFQIKQDILAEYVGFFQSIQPRPLRPTATIKTGK